MFALISVSVYARFLAIIQWFDYPLVWRERSGAMAAMVVSLFPTRLEGQGTAVKSEFNRLTSFNQCLKYRFEQTKHKAKNLGIPMRIIGEYPVVSPCLGW